MLKHATKFTPVEAGFQTAQDAGFQFAEFWLNAELLEQWEAIVQTAARYSLGYVLHAPNRVDLQDDTLNQALQLYEALKCAAMVMHQPVHDRYGNELSARNPDLRLGVENHRLTHDELDAWAKRNRWLTLDVEHVWKFTLRDAPLDKLLETLDNLLSQHIEKVVHVHLPGYLPGREEHQPMYASREMVFAVLTLLQAHNYDGFVVGEARTEFQNVTELRMDRLLFQRWSELHESTSPHESTPSEPV